MRRIRRLRLSITNKDDQTRVLEASQSTDNINAPPMEQKPKRSGKQRTYIIGTGCNASNQLTPNSNPCYFGPVRLLDDFDSENNFVTNVYAGGNCSFIRLQNGQWYSQGGLVSNIPSVRNPSSLHLTRNIKEISCFGERCAAVTFNGTMLQWGCMREGKSPLTRPIELRYFIDKGLFVISAVVCAKRFLVLASSTHETIDLPLPELPAVINQASSILHRSVRPSSFQTGEIYCWSINKPSEAYFPDHVKNFKHANGSNYGFNEMQKFAIAGGSHASYILAVNKKQCSRDGDNTGLVFSYGYGGDGRLGYPAYDEFITTPAQVSFKPGTSIYQIKCGSAHVVCASADHEVYTWGDNHVGQLNFENSPAIGRESHCMPIKCPIPEGSFVLSVQAGGYHSGAIYLPPSEAKPMVALWGWSEEGQINQVNHVLTNPSHIPVELALGISHSVILIADISTTLADELNLSDLAGTIEIVKDAPAVDVADDDDVADMVKSMTSCLNNCLLMPDEANAEMQGEAKDEPEAVMIAAVVQEQQEEEEEEEEEEESPPSVVEVQAVEPPSAAIEIPVEEDVIEQEEKQSNDDDDDDVVAQVHDVLQEMTEAIEMNDSNQPDILLEGTNQDNDDDDDDVVVPVIQPRPTTGQDVYYGNGENIEGLLVANCARRAIRRRSKNLK